MSIELLAKIFLGFLFYSFIGWAMEVIISLFKEKRFVDRGFLVGPYCPIYGVGMGLVLLLTGDTTDIWATFLKAAVYCTVLEYVVSYLMEKLFKIRWWDYSEHKFNLNGRVYLGGAVAFGSLSCGAVYLVQPVFTFLIDQLDTTWLLILAGTLLVIFIADIIFSLFIMAQIRKKSIKFASDGTDEVKEYLFNWLKEKSFAHRRYLNATVFTDLRERVKREEEKIAKLRKKSRAQRRKLARIARKNKKLS